MPCGLCTRANGSTRSGSISGTPLLAMPVYASIIFCSARPWRSVSLLPALIVRCEAATTQAIMRPPGSNWRKQRSHRWAGAGAWEGELHMAAADPFDLERFVTAQEPVFETVLAE